MDVNISQLNLCMSILPDFDDNIRALLFSDAKIKISNSYQHIKYIRCIRSILSSYTQTTVKNIFLYLRFKNVPHLKNGQLSIIL